MELVVMRRVLIFLTTLLLAVTATAFAQGEQVGAVRGRLATSDGLALPGATVTVVSPSLQGGRTVASDINGVYSIPGLPAGDYTGRFERAGLATVGPHGSAPPRAARLV